MLKTFGSFFLQVLTRPLLLGIGETLKEKIREKEIEAHPSAERGAGSKKILSFFQEES